MVETALEAYPSPGDRLAEEAAGAVRERSSVVPSVALILGSGLGDVAAELAEPETFSYADLPGFPAPSVPGHAGELSLGLLDGVATAAFRGRIHYYEGHELSLCGLPARLARLLGAETLVVTAAAGALDRGLEPGSIVVGTDQVNLLGAVLRGWRKPDGSPPFVDMSDVYDTELATLALERGRELGLPVSPGVYVAMPGPVYETPAEVAMLRSAGGSVVGMSVVPETTVARALGMRVLGLFSVTNHAGEHATHDDVLAMADRAAATTRSLLREVLPRLADAGARTEAARS